MRLVLLETPFAGNIERNTEYALKCMLDCLDRGEAPFASHLLYTRVLDDTNPDQRTLGIEAGLRWGTQAEASVVYTDLGVSSGMKLGIDAAYAAGRPVEFRTLPQVFSPGGNARDGGISVEHCEHCGKHVSRHYSESMSPIRSARCEPRTPAKVG